jgi:hypothetical protein
MKMGNYLRKLFVLVEKMEHSRATGMIATIARKNTTFLPVEEIQSISNKICAILREHSTKGTSRINLWVKLLSIYVKN